MYILPVIMATQWYLYSFYFFSNLLQVNYFILNWSYFIWHV